MRRVIKSMAGCLMALFVFLIVLCMLYPPAFLLGGSLKSMDELGRSLGILWDNSAGFSWSFLPKEPTLRHYLELLLDSPGYFVMFWNSVKVVAGVVFGQLLVGVPAAWAFARYDFSGKKILLSLYIALMLFPFQVLMLSEYLVLNRVKLIDTLWALILPGIFSTFPVFIMHRFFAKVPKVLIETAMLDGANEFQIFWHIGIAVGRPGIMSVIVLGVLEYWNLIEQPAVFLRSEYLRPLSLYMSSVTKENIGSAFVAAVVALVPPLLCFLWGREYLEEGIAKSAIKD